MALVTAHRSLSLDGFYAGPKPADTDDWMESPEAAAFFRITKWVVGAMAWRERQGYEGGERSTNSDILQDMFESAGAYVMGRRMADGGEEAIELTPTRVIEAPDVTHIRHRIDGRPVLGGDAPE